MSKTSTAVKRKYNDKTYKRWYADMKISEYEEIENLRGNLSRPDFLRLLISKYKAEDE